MWHKILVMSLVLVMVLSLAACVAGPSAQEIVNDVIESWDDIRTYQFDMDMTLDMDVEAEGEAFEATMVLSSSGAFDLENRQMKMDMTMSTAALGEEMEVEMEMYLIGDMMYAGMEIPEIGPMWVKSAMPAGYWEEMNQVKAQIEFVEAAQVEVIGSGKVKGVDCYVLQLTPDMEQLWQLAMQQSGVTGEEILPAIDEEFLQEIFQSFSMKQWIAKDTYLLTKVAIDMAVELTPEALGFPEEEGLMTMDIFIVLLAYDYNQQVSIVLPPEAEEAVEVPAW